MFFINTGIRPSQQPLKNTWGVEFHFKTNCTKFLEENRQLIFGAHLYPCFPGSVLSPCLLQLGVYRAVTISHCLKLDLNWFPQDSDRNKIKQCKALISTFPTVSNFVKIYLDLSKLLLFAGFVELRKSQNKTCTHNYYKSESFHFV
jgi:hypothetical protein